MLILGAGDAMLVETRSDINKMCRRPKARARIADSFQTKLLENFPEASIVGYEALIDSMTNHPKDRLVLAAAVVAQSVSLVTFNLMDFSPV